MGGHASRSGRSLAWAALLAFAIVAVALGGRWSVSPANAESVVHLTAMGDIGNSPEAAATLVKVGDLNADAHMVLGDLAYTSNPESEWCDFVTARVGAGFPFELVTGNHESNGINGDINDFSACLPNQIPGAVGTYGREYYYDLPRANPTVRVVNVSAGQTFPEGTWNYAKGDSHYAWTAKAIDQARSSGIPWIIVNTHYPCLSVSVYSCAMPPSFFSLLQEKKVDLVLNGHDHAYMRTHQLRSGISGCPSIPINTFDSDCVSDSDSQYQAGAGTIFATVGTGGVPLRDVNLADTEAPYFAATSGLNRQPTWGVLDLRITATELDANFVRSAGASFTDGFTITKGTAPNSPPNPQFTVAENGLSVTTDGSGSSDPDGSISSYAWNFGDGSTAVGATPATHSYAAAGTYQISLKVTDDQGSSATVNRSVTVSAPPSGAPPVPSGLTGRPLSQTAIRLSWNQSAGATSYTVRRNGTVVGSTDGTSFDDNALSPETSYSYTVSASNADGTSPVSGTVSVTTKTYVVSGDVWRLNDSGADLGTSWRAPSFNDSAWRSGPTQMGYGDGDEATLLKFGSNAAAKPITNYARVSFDAGSDISKVTGLSLRALIDDGAVVYLNGQEVWRFNLPTGTITSTTKASRYIAGSEEQLWRTTALPAGALRTGMNTVAVEVHNDQPASSDISLDLELRPVK